MRPLRRGFGLTGDAIRRAILEAVTRRGAGKTVCPSEVARALALDWRPLMPSIRAEAETLRRSGMIAVTRRGQAVRADDPDGPIRLGLPDA